MHHDPLRTGITMMVRISFLCLQVSRSLHFCGLLMRLRTRFVFCRPAIPNNGMSCLGYLQETKDGPLEDITMRLVVKDCNVGHNIEPSRRGSGGFERSRRFNQASRQTAKYPPRARHDAIFVKTHRRSSRAAPQVKMYPQATEVISSIR